MLKESGVWSWVYFHDEDLSTPAFCCCCCCLYSSRGEVPPPAGVLTATVSRRRPLVERATTGLGATPASPSSGPEEEPLVLPPEPPRSSRLSSLLFFISRLHGDAAVRHETARRSENLLGASHAAPLDGRGGTRWLPRRWSTEGASVCPTACPSVTDQLISSPDHQVSGKEHAAISVVMRRSITESELGEGRRAHPQASL